MKKIVAGAVGLIAIAALSLVLITQGGDDGSDPIINADATEAVAGAEDAVAATEGETPTTEQTEETAEQTQEENAVAEPSPPSTTAVAEQDESAGPVFATDIEVGQLGETFLRFRFKSSESTSYTTVVKRDGDVVSTQEGSVKAGQVEAERIDGLEPGTLYTAQITLIGPPTVQSYELLFRTDGDEGDPVTDALTEKVEFIDLKMTSAKFDRIQFDYKSNVCANASFVVIEEATGEEVGRNDGHPNGCTDKHLAIPGQWTARLQPETSYVVLISLEANGFKRGRQYGNAVTETMVITTPARPVPADPVERSVAAVEFAAMQQMETTDSTVRIDFETNVCANASFVIREVGGEEVGRHDGSPRGCSTGHSAVAGLWTPALEPDTSYVIVVTAEADGLGQGEGNVATDTITVRTAATPPEVDPNNEDVEIASVSAELIDGEVVATVSTNICSTAIAATFEQAGAALETATSQAECSVDHVLLLGSPSVEGNTVVVVTVDVEVTPGTPANRATTSVLVS